MFPDLTRDDVFRLETRRLWLRWPRASDAPAIKRFAGLREVAEMTAVIPNPYPQGEAERFILEARLDNAAGLQMVMAITLKSGARDIVGLVSAVADEKGEVELGYILSPTHWGKGIATEASQAMIDATFSLTGTNDIVALSRVINPGSRRVLEKCGFAYQGTKLEPLPARGGMHPCDGFRLDRKVWASLKDWRMPSMTHQRRESAAAEARLPAEL
jgi:RimJ/RimL family protein N-acetyltransferase